MELEKTSYNQFTSLARTASTVILAQTIPLAMTASDCVRHLKSHHKHIALIDFHAQQTDHFSFIGCAPHTILSTSDSKSTIEENGVTIHSTRNPFHLLKQLRHRHKAAYFHPAARLTGSPIGFLGYDSIQYIENILSQHTAHQPIPDLCFYFFNQGFYFDYANQTVTISVVASTQNLEQDYANGMHQIQTLIQQLNTPIAVQEELIESHDSFVVEPNDAEFIEKVKIAKEYIRKGDIFQTVLSRTFTKSFYADPIDLYAELTHLNPSPYQFYFQDEHFTFLGASPEKIIRIQDRVVTSTPLAGTRPTGECETKEIVEELLADEKELAEHMMLVDLARNDIGKISIPGSVSAERLTYPIILKHVIHLGSDVKGQLHPNSDAIDALQANFPAGTLSGAPKIRAMEIIDELETSRRGLYGGCIAAFDHEDNLETCILIRTAVINKNKIYVRTGCGVVYDSNPISEALETIHKAKSVLNAVRLCEQKLKTKENVHAHYYR